VPFWDQFVSHFLVCHRALRLIPLGRERTNATHPEPFNPVAMQVGNASLPDQAVRPRSKVGDTVASCDIPLALRPHGGCVGKTSQSRRGANGRLTLSDSDVS
jgi:hypothetical protein